MAAPNWHTRIEATPDTCHGKPRLSGTRVLVSVILDNLAAGYDADQIVAEYPSLTRDDIRACLAYAAHLAREEESLPLQG